MLIIVIFPDNISILRRVTLVTLTKEGVSREHLLRTTKTAVDNYIRLCLSCVCHKQLNASSAQGELLIIPSVFTRAPPA